MRPRIAAVTVLATALALSACDDNAVGIDSSSHAFVVSGTIDNRKGAPIPGDARVLVVWMVPSTDPDQAYIYGQGRIDRVTNTFTVTFDGPPPADALIQPYGVGVGMVIVTTDATLREGRVSAPLDESRILGLSAQHAVIYLNGDPAALLTDPDDVPVDWLRAFQRGFNVGEGITIPDSDYDGFKPVAPSAMALILDDLANITVVNWT